MEPAATYYNGVYRAIVTEEDEILPG